MPFASCRAGLSSKSRGLLFCLGKQENRVNGCDNSYGFKQRCFCSEKKDEFEGHRTFVASIDEYENLFERDSKSLPPAEQARSLEAIDLEAFFFQICSEMP